MLAEALRRFPVSWEGNREISIIVLTKKIFFRNIKLHKIAWNIKKKKKNVSLRAYSCSHIAAWQLAPVAPIHLYPKYWQSLTRHKCMIFLFWEYRLYPTISNLMEARKPDRLYYHGTISRSKFNTLLFCQVFLCDLSRSHVVINTCQSFEHLDRQHRCSPSMHLAEPAAFRCDRFSQCRFSSPIL